MSELDDDLRQEIETHLAMRAEHDRSSRAEATKRFGNITQTQEAMRRMHVAQWTDEVWQDLRYAWRSAIQTPAFTVAVIAALALGVGVSTAVFSVVDRILFRPLPFPQEDRLVWLGITAPFGGGEEFLLAGDYYYWKDQQKVFSHFTASGSGSGPCDITEGTATRAACFGADFDFLDTFGVRPVLGQSFGADAAKETILISHAVWQTRYGGDPSVLGRTLEVDGAPCRILGVLPANFEVPSLLKVDIFRPMRYDVAQQRSGKGPQMLINVWGRLQPGLTLQQAQAGLQPLFDRSLRVLPKSFVKEAKLSLTPLHERQSRRAASISWALLAAVFSLVLIACANVANLFLARASARERDSATRAAIGASRGRLIRQNFVESFALAAVGGIVGATLGHLLLRAAISFAPTGIPRLQQASLDGRVLVFSFLVTSFCALLCGLAPALRRNDPQSLTSRRATARRTWTRPALVATQIAFASALLYTAALLSESLWRMQSVPLGLATENVLTAEFELSQKLYAEPSQRLAFWRQLSDRIAGLPGVAAFAMSDSLPPIGRAGSMIFAGISIDHRESQTAEGTGGMVPFRSVSPGYFKTLGIPILRGSDLLPADSGKAAVISQMLAERLYGSIEVVGRPIRLGLGEPWLVVRGVAANVVNSPNLSSAPEYYQPIEDDIPRRRSMYLSIRTNADLRAMQNLVRGAAAEVDSRLPVQFATIEQRASSLTEGSRFNAVVLGLFSIAGLLLGASGVYGVVSFLVAQRTRELGVRMALGATSRQVGQLVLRYALLCAVAGCFVAALLMFAILPKFQGLLFETRTVDWRIGLAVLVTMAAIALLAAIAPALRAARLHPLDALRQDG